MKKTPIRKRLSAAIEILFSASHFYVLKRPQQASSSDSSISKKRRYILTIAPMGLEHNLTPGILCGVESWPELTGLDSTPLAIAERGKPNLGYKEVILVRFGESNYCQWFGRAPLGEHIPIGRIMEICELSHQIMK